MDEGDGIFQTGKMGDEAICPKHSARTIQELV